MSVTKFIIRQINHYLTLIVHFTVIAILAMGVLMPQTHVDAASSLSITPITWNVIGLDSNSPANGPYRFPVGARLHNTSGSTVTATVNIYWDDGGGVFWGDIGANAYINLRTGSNQVLTRSIPAGGYVDAIFEVEVLQNSSAFDKTRLYHITAHPSDLSGDVSTPQPRELYVEHLISQNRNGVRDIKLDGTTIPAGGTMSLQVGHTYNITLDGFTATQGYNQFEDFINLPNTVFQVNSVSTTYAADSNLTHVPNPNPSLYADACTWDSNPASPTYRSCIGGDDKAGGDPVATIYNVTVLPSAVTSGTLNTLLYDFSGSSYHYNADYGVTYYFIIVDPTQVTINKSFNPKAYNPASVDHSLLTITLSNPTTVTVTGVHFSDPFPNTGSGAPGNLQIYNTTTTNTCGGNLYNNTSGSNPIAVNDGGIKLVGGSIPANSTCTITVNVKVSANGDYTNTTDHLYVDVGGSDTDTGRTATDTLKVGTTPACTNGTLVQWTFSSTQVPAITTPNPAYDSTPGLGSGVSSALASFSAVGTGGSDAINTTEGSPALNSWEGSGFQKSVVYTETTTPWFDFSVDAREYSNLQISMRSYATANWTTNNILRVWYSTNGGVSYSSTTPATGTLTKTTWSGDQVFAGPATGTSTTIFRVNADGANPDGATIMLDTVVITGCHVTTPEPLFSKSFSSGPIAKNATSTLSFTIDNTNASVPGNRALSSIAFTDTLPVGLTVATTSPTSTCGGSLTTTAPRTISFSGGSLAQNSSCTFNVTVTGAVAGHYDNVTGYLSTTETGATRKYAEDTLDVISPPVLSKAFNLSSILLNGTSTLMFTLTNPNNFAAGSLSGIEFTDNNTTGWPSGVTMASGGPTAACNGGSYTTTSPNSLTFSGGSLAANASCSFSVTVTGATVGLKVNTTSTVTATGPIALTGNTATANLVVNNPVPLVGLSKQVSTDGTNWSKYVGLIPTHNVWYKFTISNEGEVALNGISVTDPSYTVCALPATLAIGTSNSCILGPISVTAAPSPNPYVNTATATTTTYTPTTPITSTAKYGTESIAIVKYVTESYFTIEGNTLHYRYAVTNDGGYPLVGPITVSDDKAGIISCQDPTAVGDLDSFFDPGETVLCPGPTASDFVTYSVQAADVTAKQVVNIARGIANLIGGGTVNSLDASKTVPLAPDLTATKINSITGDTTSGTMTYGDPPFIWTVTVANSASAGPATFSGGATILTDTIPVAGAGYALGAVTYSGTTGTVACAIDGSFVLTCSTSGPFTMPTSSFFSVPVTVTPNAAGTLVNPKNVSGVCKVDPGAGVITEIDETNNNCNSNTVTVNKVMPTVTTTIHNALDVTVTSVLLGTTVHDSVVVSGGVGTPTSTVTFSYFTNGTCTVPVTATSAALALSSGSLDATGFTQTPGSGGNYSFQATYSGDPNYYGETGICELLFVQNPELTLVKSITSGSPYSAVGGTINYSYAVTNSGNVSLAGPVTVSDDQATVSCPNVNTVGDLDAYLDPLESLTCTASHTVTQANLNAGSLTNTADASADGTTSNTDTATATALFDPPFGVKTVDATGIPVLAWTMVWINGFNIVELNAAVSDEIPVGTTYVPGSILCIPASALTHTDTCLFEPASGLYPRGRIVWTGQIGPDLGATDAASAANELVITFQVTVNTGINSVQNEATIDADLNGNGNLTDPNEQRVAFADASWTRASTLPTILPSTGFAPHRVTGLPSQNVFYTDQGDLWLEIPRLGLQMPIVGVPQVNGVWDVSWLGSQAGWLNGTAFPTWTGNSVMTGHVYNAFGNPGPFVHLNWLWYGDKIIVHAWGARYIYEVRSVMQVTPDAISSVIKHEELSWVTLITCRSYDEANNSYKYRVVIRAVLVEVK